jgi:plasmid maintenance system antidote protein VapI
VRASWRIVLGRKDLVTRQAINNIVNGKSGISPEMAIRLTKAFGGAEDLVAHVDCL